MGGSSGNVGGGVSVGIPVGQGNVSREITIDFVDHSKKQLFMFFPVLVLRPDLNSSQDSGKVSQGIFQKIQKMTKL